MFGMGRFYDVLLIAGILGVQYFLSTRKNAFWGLVLPFAFFIWRMMVLLTEEVDVSFHLAITILGLAFLIGQWKVGRRAVNEKEGGRSIS